MAKIVVAGDAVVITSDMKLEDIKTIKKVSSGSAGSERRRGW